MHVKNQILSPEFIIKKTIKQNGPIPISEFMEYSLSGKNSGYYTNYNPIGTTQDFITSPEISQIFGEIIGLYLAKEWISQGRAEKIILVELGPGKATLMHDLLRATKHIAGFHQAIELVNLIDINHVLKAMQYEKLKDFPEFNFKWDNYFVNYKAPIYLIANEFFDCLPINQYVRGKNCWFEIMVDIDQVEEPFFTKKIVNSNDCNMLDYEYPKAKEDDIFEISPQSIEIIQQISTNIQQFGGAALIVDYGYYKSSKNYISSLQAIRKHQFYPILKDLGQADITVHVNFLALENAAIARGAKTEVITQEQFLIDNGAEMRFNNLYDNATASQKLSLASGFDRLINSNKMGTLFKVLALSA